jgi:hypothetical protein
MTEFAKLSGKEMLHYAKHLVRGWWQDLSIKFEAINVFFSKSGISLLGAMILWAGEKEVKGE